MIKILLCAAVFAAPLFAMEPTLENQKHDSSLMMDGMKSLDSKVEASWVSKEQTETASKAAASSLKETQTEIAPAVKAAKTRLAADKNKINTVLPSLPEEPDTHKAEKISAGAAGLGVIALGVAAVLKLAYGDTGIPYQEMAIPPVIMGTLLLAAVAAAAAYGVAGFIKDLKKG